MNPFPPHSTLHNAAGLRAGFHPNGALHALMLDALCLQLFPGTAVESGTTSLYLRLREGDRVVQAIPLMGPRSRGRWQVQGRQWRCTVEAAGLQIELDCTLAPDQPWWCWRLQVRSQRASACVVDAVLLQDVALAPFETVRINEFYISQYLDHCALTHPQAGPVLVTRQNLADPQGRHPALLTLAPTGAIAWATDGLQALGLPARVGQAALACTQDLPSRRLQNEHALHALQHVPVDLEAAGQVQMVFACALQRHHPEATGPADLGWADRVLAAVADDASRAEPMVAQAWQVAVASVFDQPPLETRDARVEELQRWCDGDWHHVERDAQGQLLSFFEGPDQRHVVTRRKEMQVLRPHGHLLRTGAHLSPDENSLTSTCWMTGVFASMLTEGHVSANRILTTLRGNLGTSRAAGQRVLVELDGQWRQLLLPSAFGMTRSGATWWYAHAQGLIRLQARASEDDDHAIDLDLRVLEGAPCRFLVTHQLAWHGDDGRGEGGQRLETDPDGGVRIRPAPGSVAARRYGPDAAFSVQALAGTGAAVDIWGDDALLFEDGQSRQSPMLVLRTRACTDLSLRMRSHLLAPDTARDRSLPQLADLQLPVIEGPASHGKGVQPGQVHALSALLPWMQHNALVHYLAPRGLEQFTGGGWGTRDVSQGPVELLLSQGCHAPVRDLLLRLFAAQDASGDWPQWFMFFERDRQVRAGDSHGDIVFWPLLALGQYLQASADGALLDGELPFHAPADAAAPERGTLWQHVQRALAVIAQRRIAGTSLAAYGHGDWNDALQPADPALREHLCSAWTVTLHYQMLITLAAGLEACGQPHAAHAQALRVQAGEVLQAFHTHLLPDGVLTGYAFFEAGQARQYLLHPRDAQTGAHYSLLPMIHALINEMLTPEQAGLHLDLIGRHLSGPDGARLFDRPFVYRGGLQTLFQRAESSSFFGREIGLMYTHAHLRWVEALAHMGRAEDFLRALAQVNPVGLQQGVPQARLRQANSYFSSSDACFDDRYQAVQDYDRMLQGEVPFEAGWRVYSSGAGITLGLVWRCLLGWRQHHDAVDIDPVMPLALDGLRVQWQVDGQALTVVYRIAARGCGVQALMIDGQPLAFERQPHRYRTGAARVSRAALQAALQAARRREGAEAVTLEVRVA